MIKGDLHLKPKVMLISKRFDCPPLGGRELLCQLNYDCLQDICQKKLVFFELKRQVIQKFNALLGAFNGNIDGLDVGVIAKALQTIQDETVTKVFVDGSNLGAFVAELKRTMPNVEVISFFHNVEARFFLGSLKQRKSLHALAVLMVNYLAERKAVRYSDKIICLSERDSGLLKQIYGRGATHISPMALQDKLPDDYAVNTHPNSERFALFVGGAFYANRAGITWFVRHVVPNIQIKVCVVGKGFENLKHELEREGKVQVVGAVDNLADWYRNAHFVIAPIFDGSGMKTKVAEALMYGKRIVGTPEAFAGYEDIADKVGWRCTTVNEFVDAISLARDGLELGFDPQLRAIFEEKYSMPAAKARLADILECSITEYR